MNFVNSIGLAAADNIDGLLIDKGSFSEVTLASRPIPNCLRQFRESWKTANVERLDVLAFVRSTNRKLRLELYDANGEPRGVFDTPSHSVIVPEQGNLVWIFGQDKNEGLEYVGCSWPPRYQGIYLYDFDGIKSNRIGRDVIGSLDMKGCHVATTSTGSLIVAHRKASECFVTRINPSGEVEEIAAPPWLNEGLAEFCDGELLSVSLYYGDPVRGKSRRRAILFRRDGTILWDFESGLDSFPRIVAANMVLDTFVVQTDIEGSPGTCSWEMRKISDPQLRSDWIRGSSRAQLLVFPDDGEFVGALFTSGDMAVLRRSGQVVARLPKADAHGFYSSRVKWDGSRFEFRTPERSIFLRPG